MQATDYAIQLAKAEAIKENSPVIYKDFWITTWHIEGYGWTGETRDTGNNLYPNWMQPQKGYKMRWQAVEFMKARIDEYLQKVQAVEPTLAPDKGQAGGSNGQESLPLAGKA